MRLALISDCYFPTRNGVVTALRQLAEGLAARGHEVLIVTVYERFSLRRLARPRWSRYRPEPPGKNDRGSVVGRTPVVLYRFPSVPLFPSARIRFGCARKAALEQIFLQQRIELVHTHTEFGIARQALRAARELEIPCIHTLHTTYEDYLHYLKPLGLFRKSVLKRFWAGFLAKYGEVVCPSLHVQSFVRRCAPEVPASCVPNGIDVGEWSGRAAENLPSLGSRKTELRFGEDERIVLYFGRLAREKRSGALLRIFLSILEEAERRSMPVRCLFLGGGPLEAAIVKAVRRSGAGGAVLCTGYVDRDTVRRLCAAADIFVTASLSENHPYSLIEAQAAGLPVLARRSPGISSVVRDGESGVLADTDGKLAEAAVALLVDAPRRQRMAESARQNALRFGVSAHTAQLLEAYRRVLSRRPSRSESP